METPEPSPEPESLPSSPGFLKSIQARLLILLLIIIIPVLAVQISTYRKRFQERRWQEIQGNLEIARSTN